MHAPQRSYGSRGFAKKQEAGHEASEWIVLNNLCPKTACLRVGLALCVCVGWRNHISERTSDPELQEQNNVQMKDPLIFGVTCAPVAVIEHQDRSIPTRVCMCGLA